MSNELHEQLAEFDEAWKNADIESKEFETLPDGKYQAIIDECRFEQSKGSGRWQLAWVLKVVAPGQHKNRKIFAYHGLNNDVGIAIMKRSVYACGVTVESLRDLPGQIPYLIDRVVEVTLKSNKKEGKDYQNMYINKLLSMGEAGSNVAADEDIPF